MLNVNIICIGKLKEKYLKDACAEYEKRLAGYCKFSIIELPEYKIQDDPSDAQISKTVTEEGKKILDKIPKGSYIISMCIEGKMHSSEELGAILEEVGVKGISSVTFIIGGSWGISDEVKKISDLRLSMSRMTFPHQLARVLLCEQIYRGFTIINSGKYHK